MMMLPDSHPIIVVALRSRQLMLLRELALHVNTLMVLMVYSMQCIMRPPPLQVATHRFVVKKYTTHAAQCGRALLMVVTVVDAE